MKLFKIGIWINLFLVTLLFSFGSNKRNYQMECKSQSNEGYVTIKIWDLKRGSKYKLIQAQKDAIHGILFAGLSGGSLCGKQPPILKNTEDQQNFGRLEKQFFSQNGKWSNFVRSSELNQVVLEKVNGCNIKSYVISVSKNELQKYLEEQNIISKLNNGF